MTLKFVNTATHLSDGKARAFRLKKSTDLQQGIPGVPGDYIALETMEKSRCVERPSEELESK